MNSFCEYLKEWPPERVNQLFEQADSPVKIKSLLDNRNSELTESDLAALLSPAAAPYLEPLARKAAALTRRRFGWTMQFYVPLYVSNYCVNYCVYCGFNRTNQVSRRSLSIDEAEAEAKILAEQGFGHLLLVSGEDRNSVPVEYFEKLIKRLNPRFAAIAIEIYPLTEDEYARLMKAGADSLTLYQETYDRERYREVHPFGPKRDFEYRLASIERAARAGITFIGIGTLLGLSDWRFDQFYTGLHARWLSRTYWRSQISISFPRLRRASGGFSPAKPVNNTDLVQAILAQRLFLPDAGLVLSTREPAELRDRLIPLGITRISAGSKTQPGGYDHDNSSEPQFDVMDQRSMPEMYNKVRELGFAPVTKNWDQAYHCQQ